MKAAIRLQIGGVSVTGSPQSIPCKASAIFVLLLLALLPAKVKADDFLYVTNTGAITITGYTGAGGAVAIPDTINGLPVTMIGLNAFQSQSTITSVNIPNSVVSIQVGAFSSCLNLGGVAIGSGVTNIGTGAFLFSTNLAAFTVDALNTVYSSVSGVVFNKAQTSLILFPPGRTGSYTIPAGITDIAFQAFDDCSLNSVTISDGVTSMADQVFSDCAGLTNVVIGNGLTNIGYRVFGYCQSLVNLTLGTNMNSIGDAAFLFCSSLTNVTIPNSVRSIGQGSFNNCSSLATVTIGTGITNIGAFAFDSCENLLSVFFLGNAPSADATALLFSDLAFVCYLPGTTGWGPTFGGRPAVQWNSMFQTHNRALGISNNCFGVNIVGGTNIPIVIEANTNLVTPNWRPVQRCLLTNGLIYFCDTNWTARRTQGYRIRTP